MSELEMEVDTAHSTPLYHRGRPENWLWALQREEHRGYEGLLLEGRRGGGGWQDEDLAVYPQPPKHKAWTHQHLTDAVLLPCSKNSDLLFKFFKVMDSTWEIKMLEEVESVQRKKFQVPWGTRFSNKFFNSHCFLIEM